jgi:hypothetical protein
MQRDDFAEVFAEAQDLRSLEMVSQQRREGPIVPTCGVGHKSTRIES